ncbi:MAG: MerR family transcriptional regulator [Acidimicrobiia bacterium]
MSELTVGSLARLAGVTVRTLHHYHDIGLVVPAGRTESGYRTYGPPEVERLQEVLFFRELGFPLEAIRDVVGRQEYTRAAALRRQRELLEARAEHVIDMIDAVDRAIAAERTGVTMTNEEMLEVFGDFDPAQYEEETKERWGDTDAYKESARRVSRYTKDDWKAMQADADAINQDFLKLMAAGIPAGDPAAMDLAERHRLHITRWFYDCTKEIHAGLGQMYVADVRFKENIDKAGDGLAEFLSAAIAANAVR